jgi:hypothetical protein
MLVLFHARVHKQSLRVFSKEQILAEECPRKVMDPWTRANNDDEVSHRI